MRICKLDHVNIRTTRLDVMVAWYADVLGLQPGDRPDFSFPGAWLYSGDAAIVHLNVVDGDPPVGSEVELKLEHFAFSATGQAAFETKLKKMGIRYRLVEIKSFGFNQINLWDPDGNHLHVDFRADE